MAHARSKFTFTAFVAAAVGVALTVVPVVATGASAVDLIGQVGTLQAASPQANGVGYWEDLYADQGAKCYKSSTSSSRGALTDGAKTVTLNASLNPYADAGWVVLVVKAANTNNVIENPVAGVAYASPGNNGGQQATVSHWIVCEGKASNPYPTVVTPTLDWSAPSCTAEGVATPSDDAEWSWVENADGTTTWTATPKAGTEFPADFDPTWVVPDLSILPPGAEECRPAQPDDVVTKKELYKYDCDSYEVTITTIVTTVESEWNGSEWVEGEPADDSTTTTRAMTVDEKLDCPLPDSEVEYGAWEDGDWDCGDTEVAQTREVTTTSYEYDELGNPLAKSTLVTETQTRELSQDEIGECPLVPGEILSSCQGDVPSLAYEVSLPEGFEPEGDPLVTITFVNNGGEDYVVEGLPLSGSILWPGARATEPKMWPGWDLVNGTYVQTEGNYAWTREDVLVRFEVNPTFQATVEYPAASSLCANPPKQAISPQSPPTDGEGDPGTPGSSDDGPDGALAATGTQLSLALPLGGGAVLLMGLSVVLLAAYRRSRTASSRG